MITLIAAIGKNRELGYKNQLLWKISEDMKHFREYTTGKVVIMGRNTFASIGRVLPGRKCIVVTSKGVAGLAIVAKDVESALSVDHCYPELVVIGGAQIYAQTIDLADKLVITHVDAEFEADTYFPQIDLARWKLITTVTGLLSSPYNYKFCEYSRL